MHFAGTLAILQSLSSRKKVRFKPSLAWPSESRAKEEVISMPEKITYSEAKSHENPLQKGGFKDILVLLRRIMSSEPMKDRRYSSVGHH